MLPLDSWFSWIVCSISILLIPIIGISYIGFRLNARREQLCAFFSRPGILEPYLRSRGESIPVSNSTKENLAIFDKLFRNEFSQEYGTGAFLCSLIAASVSSALVIVVLSFGKTFIPDSLIQPLFFALFGGFVWNVSSLVGRYNLLEITPSLFYRMQIRYLLSLALGLLVVSILREGELANLTAFVLATLPDIEVWKFVRRRAGLGEIQDSFPPLSKIQGMNQSTLEQLDDMGIHTTQELAFADPLRLLFRSNFPPRTVLDWIDQALLYNFVGDAIHDLRTRGIRRAIELAKTLHYPAVFDDLAKVLKLTKKEFTWLVYCLKYQPQVDLLLKIHGAFIEDNDLFAAERKEEESEINSLKNTVDR